MALAPKIEYTIRDGDGDVAVTAFYAEIGRTLVDYQELAEQHAEVVEGVILGEIDLIAGLSVPVDISSLTGNTVADDSDVEQIAAFQFSDADGEPVNLNVPAVNNLDIVVGSDALDQTDTQIAALITMMESGIAVTGGTILPCSIREADIQDTIYARKETRNSGRRS